MRIEKRHGISYEGTPAEAALLGAEIYAALYSRLSLIKLKESTGVGREWMIY